MKRADESDVMARHARYDRHSTLKKAITLFWERGYHGSSLKQIEQALDMRPGSIYATFGSKDGLFSEALATYAEQVSQELQSYLNATDSIVEGLQSYLRGIAQTQNDLDGQPARACMIVKTLLESSNTHPSLAQQARQILVKIQEVLREALEVAKGRGELPASTDSRRLARLLQAQIIGIRSIAESDLAPHDLSDLGDDAASILEAYRLPHNPRSDNPG